MILDLHALLATTPEARSVRWVEYGGPRMLRCEWAMEGEVGRATLRLTAETNGGRILANATLSGKRWEFDYALPVRVGGFVAPQVLVRLRRPNWMDYALYRIDEGGIRRAFGISVRDPRAIRWEVRGGALASFTLYDRWKSLPSRLLNHEPPGRRWEWVARWTFSSSRGWSPGRGRWVAYRFGSSLRGQDFSAGQCPFRYSASARQL